MPLLDSDFDQKFVRVKEEDTVSQALEVLRTQGGGDDWHLIVERPGKKLGVLGIDRLKEYLAQLGPALFDLTFEQLEARVPAASVAQRKIGIGTAEKRALADSQGVLVVMDGEEIVGRLSKAAERGADPFPASNMGQLYGDYINTHLDARASWRPKGVKLPKCPHCGHIGFYRYRVADSMSYCDHCGKTITKGD